MRVLALDHGDRPLRLRNLGPERARSRRRSTWWSDRTASAALRRSRGWWKEEGAERVLVGLPLTLGGEEGQQAERGAHVCRAARAESLGTVGFTSSISANPNSRERPEARGMPTRARQHICWRATWPASGRAPPSEPRTAARPGQWRARGTGRPRAASARPAEPRARQAAAAAAARERSPQPPPAVEAPQPRAAEPVKPPAAEPVQPRAAEPVQPPAAEPIRAGPLSDHRSRKPSPRRRPRAPCRGRAVQRRRPSSPRRPTATGATGSTRPGASRAAVTAGAPVTPVRAPGAGGAGPGALIALDGARRNRARASPGSPTRCSSRSRATAAAGQVRVTIPQGSSLAQIADRLEQRGGG